ncbi:MAG TPA: amidase domain-containing protein [Streptosporangiaceae bacterium]|nr:amidase domain-containing protein [Streptosporangiaceae bacterium]
MVDYHELDSARPPLWSEAAADWDMLGTDLGTAAGALNEQTRQPLSASWSGRAATAALSRIKAAVDSLEAAQGEVSAVGETLQGLAEAATVAQQLLGDAQAMAERASLTIAADGSVTQQLPPPFLPTAQPATMLGTVLSPQVQQVEQIVSEAIQRASMADQLTAAELDRLATRANVANLQLAYNTDAADASRTELAAMTASIPVGPPNLVARWWAGLSGAEQAKLELAAPTTLATLAGIPAGVQAELRGSDGIDRVRVIQYALTNWNKTVDRRFTDDCTNFVSDALLAGGLQQKQEGFWPFDHGNSQVNWYTDPWSLPRSYSWTKATDLHTFLTHNNSSEIPLGQAKPGDIIFFHDPEQGIHHAAVITAVVNGHVYYTQHSGGQENADLSLRQTMYNQLGDPQDAIVVRPVQDSGNGV